MHGGNLHEGLILDGYELIRPIGSGGFGEVWLCRSEAVGGYHALKFIAGGRPELLEKEFHALVLYRREVAKLRSQHLVPIEHINRTACGLYYVMPLADGLSDGEPSDSSWRPLTLAESIRQQTEARSWFASAEIIAIMQSVLEALQVLSDAGLVHRDVKPDNILYLNDRPCLGDISLLGADAAIVTMRGTPGYVNPSWYVGGHPDMYGAAATLYSLLTGNAPDKMGRSAFLWPPHGENSLQASEQSEWKRLHCVIRRATEEKISERYVDFRAMAAALSVQADASSPPALPISRKRTRAPWLAACLFALLIAIGASIFAVSRPKEKFPDYAPPASNQIPTPPQDPPADSTAPSSSQEAVFIDAGTAYSSLTRIQTNFHRLGISFEENRLWQETMGVIQPHAYDGKSFDPREAVRKLDLCLDAIDELREIPNVMLARLLFLRAAGDLEVVNKGIDNPVFWTPGEDSLPSRVELLCRLQAADKAEQLLGQILDVSSSTQNSSAETLILRAEVRIRLGKLAEARSDATAALAAAADDGALKARMEMKLLRLERLYPNYRSSLRPGDPNTTATVADKDESKKVIGEDQALANAIARIQKDRRPGKEDSLVFSSSVILTDFLKPPEGLKELVVAKEVDPPLFLLRGDDIISDDRVIFHAERDVPAQGWEKKKIVQETSIRLNAAEGRFKSPQSHSRLFCGQTI